MENMLGRIEEARKSKDRLRLRCEAHQKTIWLWFNASLMAFLQRSTSPKASPLFPLSCYSSFSPALISLSLQSFFNHSIISENTPANKQVTSKPSKKWLKARNATDRQDLSTETFSSILDCYFSTSLSFPQSFTCCRLHTLHISSPREETHLFQICTLVGTSKEDFSNFHLWKP